MCKEAYLAGIIDGEGSLVITSWAQKNGRRYHSFILTVSNASDLLFEFLKTNFDGVVYSNGKSKGEGRLVVKKVTWVNHRALPVLEAILPYLVIKKQAAEIAIDFIKTLREHGYGRSLMSQEIIDERNRLQEMMYEANGRTRSGVRSRSYVTQEPIDLPEMDCRGCGKSFKPTDWMQSYCDKRCRMDTKNAKRNKPKEVVDA